MTDAELLNQHRNGSDSAFADLVRRHLAWVYGLARRRLGDAHLAEDVAQAVFVLLHRKSPRFAADRAMVSWLYKTACYASDSAARGERRRQHRESKVAMSRPEAAAPQEPAEWQQLAPLLDELIGRLPRCDREAILLRYYRDLSFAEVAEQIGGTADAARKRVERGIEKLRQLAAERGGTVSAASLAAGLAAFVRIPPPPGLVATATVVATAPAGSAMAASTAAIVKGAITMMASTKLTIFAGVTVACVVLGGALCGTVWMLADGQSDSINAQTPATAPTTVPMSVAKVDNIDLPFINDPDVIGDWKSVDFVREKSEFNPNRQNWKGQLFLEGLTFLENGKMPQPWMTWTKGVVIHHGDKTASHYEIQEMDGQHYLFFEWKNGDVILRGQKPSYYVMRRSEATTQAEPAANSPPSPAPAESAPFSGLRWHGEVPEVLVDGTWYELVAIDDLRVNQIISFQKSSRDAAWQKHFGEDLVDVLSRMHHPTGDTVQLQVRTLNADRTVTTLQNVPMTEENRHALMNFPASDQTSLFQAIRWQDAIPQVQINGTWYELVSVEREPAGRLVDSAKSAYGDDWQNQFQTNLMDVLKRKSDQPLYWADLQLRTLDNNERVMLTIRMPEKN
jgi:RNA polymerase sigma factor (sigma-70 family)